MKLALASRAPETYLCYRDGFLNRKHHGMSASQQQVMSLRGISDVPIAILSDSYKASHYQAYPEATEMTAYGEFRQGYDKDKADTRILFYGLRYILETYLLRQWTVKDVDQAALFFRTHLAPAHSDFAFPKALFLDFIKEHNGYFPIRLQALREGTVIHVRVPVYQITASGKYAPLCTYLETLLTMVWYQTTVATLSRRAKDVIEQAFERSVEGGRESPLLLSRLHDFGMRGCTGVEQATLGGVAHLLNFEGSDTMSAGYYAQFHLNDGRPVASSIPATEHSVMTAWRTEQEAIESMIQHYGQGLFACVMDSYDYSKALSQMLPAIAGKKVEKGGFMVLRPDSGDPVEAVIAALEAAEKVFGAETNSRGYKVPRGCGVIQGDGITADSLQTILQAVLDRGYSAQAVAFGMGSGLLHKLNRDTMSFATKLSHIRYADKREADIMKHPTAGGKDSFPGILAVKRVNGIPTVFPKDSGLVSNEEDLLQTVYDHGPVETEWESFDTLRQRVDKEWHALPPSAVVVSQELEDSIAAALDKLYGHQVSEP